MIVWRRWVFPILLVLVFGLIAVSLTKIAFFPDASAAPETPGSSISDPLTTATLGTVTNQLTLQAKVARDEDVTVRSTVGGTIVKVHAAPGSAVEENQAIITVRQDETERNINVVAPAAGSLVSSELVVGQPITLGTEVAKLSPNKFHLLATVQPVQLYRLISAPGEGTVTITGGPAPFACTNLGTQVAEDGTTSVRCQVPPEQVVFPGLPAELTINVGVAENVLTIPTTAVKGGAGSGVVWVDAGDGSQPEERTITLGITDGTVVQVLEGLSEGEQIRQFVPGFAAPTQENCYEIAPGEQHCEPAVSW